MCYKCDSHNDTACNDPVDTDKLGMDMCMADSDTCGKVIYEEGNTTITWRQCFSANITCDFIESNLKTLNCTSKYCSTCDTSHCNSANIISWSIMSIGVSLLAIFLSFK
ncbi:hypothetical protein ABEB36_005127 [Hypothenemus hampei]|uniref:Protein quiver n=1 Tax=Hypothenemus hampei TaxID=57062 RepID=A0ABD1EX45_HYPHA